MRHCHRRFRLDELPGAEDLQRDRPARPRHRRAPRPHLPQRRRPAVGAPPVQPDVHVAHGPGRGRRVDHLLPPRDRAGLYVNFKNVQQSSRKKIPFGIAQIGKCFRNEISPGNFVFRMREFEQMEMQYFVRPEAGASAAFEEWLPRRRAWYEAYGVTPERLRFREHAPDELAHYAKKAIDVEYRFPFGWKELEGIHNRGDFDLGSHAEATGREPRVLRPGDRGALHPVDRRDGGRRRPGRVHVPDRRLPRGGGPGREAGRRSACTRTSRRTRSRSCRCSRSGPRSSRCATACSADLKRDLMAVYDDTAAIGKLYRRQDEIGTPWCVTVDVDSLDDGAVTVRDRDSMTQERVPLEGVKRLILDRMAAVRP